MIEQTADPVQILPADLPDAVRHTRRESRWDTVLPLQLMTGSGELIPAVILNLSASGLLALIDIRLRGARFEIEFFFEEITVHHAVIEVLRLEKRTAYLMALGCRFVHIPPAISAALRAKIAVRRPTRYHER